MIDIAAHTRSLIATGPRFERHQADFRARPHRYQRRSAAPSVRHSAQTYRSSAQAILESFPDLPALDALRSDGVSEEYHGYPLRVRRSSSEALRLAHWLVPHRLLVGRYPFLHQQYSDRGWAEHQIKELLETGVTTFVCLQGELPPQERIQACGSGGFFAYRPIATMLHSTMCNPPDTEVTGSIRNRHLDQFLPQKRAGKQQDQAALSKKLDFVHFPIQDLSIPDQTDIQALLANLISRMKRRECLYMHCWGGRGRAGTLGACLLKAIYGIDGDEALKRVQRSFDTRQERGYDGQPRKSPETEEQREFVRAFKYDEPRL